MKPNIKKRNLAYKPHLVTYIDIMGFRTMVKEKPPNHISRVIRLVKEAFEPDAKSKTEFDEHYVNFSDLIVHTVPLNSQVNIRNRVGSLFSRILAIVHGQASLIDEGILVRGALVLGGMEKSYNVLFGPALIDAYDLEQHSASVSRVVVTPELLNDFKTEPLLHLIDHKHDAEYVRKLLRTDSDSVVFVDYLGGLANEVQPSAYLSFLRRHKSLVEEGLLRFAKNQKVLAKYIWLKNYHDGIVSECVEKRFQQELFVGAENLS